MAAGETTSRKAAQQMRAEGSKIDSSTLRYQKRNHHGEAPRRVGRPTFLTSEDELAVVDWVKLLRIYKLPVSKAALIARTSFGSNLLVLWCFVFNSHRRSPYSKIPF
jgi:hypothetical protein